MAEKSHHKCEDDAKQFTDGSLAVKGDLFVKDDLFINRNLHFRYRPEVTILPPTLTGYSVFRADLPTLYDDVTSFFVPTGTLDPAVSVVLEASFVQRNIGKSLSFIVAPSQALDTFRGTFNFYSTYLGVAGDPTLRVVAFNNTANYVINVLILATAVGPLVVVEQPILLAAPLIGSPAAPVAGATMLSM